MSTTSSSLLPPAIRVAEIVGTLGAGALAGTYLTHSSHTVPALESTKRTTTSATTGAASIFTQQPASQAVKMFHRIHRSSHKALLNLILISAGSYSYIAYYLYNHPFSRPGEKITSASAKFSSSSLIPETSVHRESAGGEFFGMAGMWMFFATGATLLMGIIPYSKVVMKNINHRLNAAGESLLVEERRGMGLQVVDEKSTWRDLEQWRKKNWTRAALAGVAGILGGMGIAKLTI